MSTETIREIRAALAGQQLDLLDAGEESDKTQPSSNDIMRNRTFRILELNARQGELTNLKKMVDDKANQLSIEKESFRKQQDDFDQRLSELDESITSTATEQARGILEAMSPADVVKNLMQLRLDQNIVLLKGMPEKSIARILKQFLKRDGQQPGADGGELEKRGQEIFEALSQGEPFKTVVDEMNRQLSQGPPKPQAAANALQN